MTDDRGIKVVLLGEAGVGKTNLIRVSMGKTFEKNVDATKKKQEKQLKERHKKLSDLKENKEEITEATIKGLNKDELKVELESLANSLDKMHYIYELGLELVDPLKKITLNKLEEKAKSAPAITVKKIEEEIEAIKNNLPKIFLIQLMEKY